MKEHFWKIVIGVAVLILVGSVVYSQYVSKQADEGIVIEEHIKGNPDAAVTLVEYSDFQCPACGQFYPYVKEVVEAHEDDLSFEYRHFPLVTIHALATAAARAAEAAGQQGAFFEMHDMLFEKQSEWSNSGNAKAYFAEYANELGLDVPRFKLQMESSIIDNVISDSFTDARNQGFTGTPTFLLNGEQMEFDSFDEFRTQIENAINAAAGSSEE